MFERKPLRAQVQREIRDRIFDGRLPAGASLNEPRLSAELGISRTPLREAMLGLEASGFLLSTMGRGFLVPPLDAAEFRDLAAVLARLESLALELGPDLPGGRVMELQNLLQRAKLSGSQPGPRATAAVAGLLSGFAAVLLAACPNRTLATDVLRLEALTARYWPSTKFTKKPARACRRLKPVYRPKKAWGASSIWTSSRARSSSKCPPMAHGSTENASGSPRKKSRSSRSHSRSGTRMDTEDTDDFKNP
ncbi:MAG: GntR family transcriptional regulator [Candidatus Krumholzibacteriia bacterium]